MKKLILVLMSFVLTSCAAMPEPQRAAIKDSTVSSRGSVFWVNNSNIIWARLNALLPSSALFKSLEEACKQGKIVEVVVSADSALSLSGKTTCFPVYMSMHPETRPSRDVLIVDSNTLIYGGDVYAVGGPEVVQEYQFQRYLKSTSY